MLLQKRIAAMFLALAMLVGLGSLATAAPAQAGAWRQSSVAVDTTADRVSTSGYGCVSNYEWNHFYVGNGLHAVERFFGTHGWLAWRSGNWAVKKYYACGSYYTIVKIKYHWNGYSWRVYHATRYH